MNILLSDIIKDRPEKLNSVDNIIQTMEENGYNPSEYSQCIENFESAPLFRCMNKDMGDIFLFKPHKRSSYDPQPFRVQNTNYHTLWFCNRKNWSKYPRRDMAIIMSLNEYLPYYGDKVYQMFVPNNATIAICDTMDINSTFCGDEAARDDYYDYYDETAMPTIYDLGHIMNELFKMACHGKFSYYPGITYRDMMKLIQKVDAQGLTETDDLFYEYNGLEDFIDSYFNPNCVRLTKMGSFDGVWGGNEVREVWTDVPCLGIRIK